MNILSGIMLVLTLATCAAGQSVAASQTLVPVVDGDFWQVAGDPDLGSYTTPNQQPVDFGVWQAVDGTWQLWSCIRSTSVPGNTRLFYRWQGKNLTDPNWTPMGIAMMADPNFGEHEGGLQAPFVLKENDEYTMFYGTWDHIAMAKSNDGKTFARQLLPDGTSSMFGADPGTNPRDPIVIKIDNLYHIYYTAYPGNHGMDFCRTSTDMIHWSDPTVVASGGAAGDGPYAAECPFVYYNKAAKCYYLWRTQHYGENSQTSVYRSLDPMNFGINNDSKMIGTIPYAAPEIFDYAGNTYMACLLANLKGIQIAKLKWVAK